MLARSPYLISRTTSGANLHPPGGANLHPPGADVVFSLSGVVVTFVLFCFRFVFSAFTEAAALRPTVLRSSICMHPDSHTQPNNYLRPFFVFLSSLFCFFGDVAFSEYFCTITISSLYGENVVCFPLLPDGVLFFHILTTGRIVDVSLLLRDNLINQYSRTVPRNENVPLFPNLTIE